MKTGNYAGIAYRANRSRQGRDGHRGTGYRACVIESSNAAIDIYGRPALESPTVGQSACAGAIRNFDGGIQALTRGTDQAFIDYCGVAAGNRDPNGPSGNRSGAADRS